MTDAGTSLEARAEFFETVRAILAVAGRGIGDDTPPAEEPIRFGVADGASHPDVEIAALHRAAGEGPVTMTVAHMGLTGPSGALPDHYSDLLVERRRGSDEALSRFLDLFNHRAISLFYRAWAKYRLPVRVGEDGGVFADPFSAALAALAGLGPGDDRALLAAAAPLARRVRSAGAISRMVSSLFSLPIAVDELRPRWVRIPAEERTRLGGGRDPRGQYAALGLDTVLGEVALDVAGRFRLRIGPLGWPAFQALLTANGPRRRLVEAVRLAVGGTIEFDIQLVLAADSVPPARVGGAEPAMLSRAGWVLSRPSPLPRDDAVLPGSAA